MAFRFLTVAHQIQLNLHLVLQHLQNNAIHTSEWEKLTKTILFLHYYVVFSAEFGVRWYRKHRLCGRRLEKKKKEKTTKRTVEY
jgi:hypothetical protein